MTLKNSHDFLQSPDGDDSNSLVATPRNVNTDLPPDNFPSASQSASAGISQSIGATVSGAVGTQPRVAHPADNMFFRENPW